MIDVIGLRWVEVWVIVLFDYNLCCVMIGFLIGYFDVVSLIMFVLLVVI